MCERKKKIKFNDYGKTVKTSKNDRLEVMKRFYSESNEIAKILNQFNGVSKKSINFNDLKAFELNMSNILNDKVSFKKVFETDDKLIFETIMQKHGEFGWHFHNDCKEVVDVMSGCIYDALTNITYNENESFTYLSGKEHVPIALKDTFLIVTFIKDKNIE